MGVVVALKKQDEQRFVTYRYTVIYISLHRHEEEIRKQQRGLKEATRELDKDKRALERQEKQLVRISVALTCIRGVNSTMRVLILGSGDKEGCETGKQTGNVYQRSVSDHLAYVWQLVTAYAKQLVKVRNQKVKSMGLSAQVTATGHQIQVRSITIIIHFPRPPRLFL